MRVVLFQDLIDPSQSPHYGMHNRADNTIVCFCCGAVLNANTCKILNEYSFSELTYACEAFFEKESYDD